MGKIINELKQKVQANYDAAAETVKQAELAARNAARRWISPCRQDPPHGRPAPPDAGRQPDHRRVLRYRALPWQMPPEIEDDDHNFTRLNVPKDHPRPRYAGYLLSVR